MTKRANLAATGNARSASLFAFAHQWPGVPDRERRDMRRKFLTITVCVLSFYTLGYGVARWRKFIVMKEYNAKEDRLLVRRTGPGRDVRDSWRGRVKNSLSPVLYVCFRPLCLAEDYVRGGTKPLLRTPNQSAQATRDSGFSSAVAEFGPWPRVPGHGRCPRSAYAIF